MKDKNKNTTHRDPKENPDKRTPGKEGKPEKKQPSAYEDIKPEPDTENPTEDINIGDDPDEIKRNSPKMK